MSNDDFVLEEPKDNSLAARFATFDAEHPIVWELYRRFAFQMIRSGRPRMSSDMILHRIRWETQIAPTSDMMNQDTGEPIKICNNWSPYYARKFAEHYPEHADFFRFRELVSERG